MKASHILVKHLYEAEDILRAIKSGKSFESLARSRSLCSSASCSGWLGDLNEKSVDAEFMKALVQLQIDEISKPIQTKFGYHLIRKEPADIEPTPFSVKK